MEAISHAPELNSGIFFRCIPGEFTNGYESQIHNGFNDGDRSKPKDFGTGGIYRRIAARRVVPNDKEWFHKTIVADGPHIAVWVNGYQVTDWTDDRKPDKNPRNGLRTGGRHAATPRARPDDGSVVSESAGEGAGEVTSAPPGTPICFLSIALAILCTSISAAEPLSLHPDNPHYFLFRGKPTILVTSGEHYGAVLNLGLRLRQVSRRACRRRPEPDADLHRRLCRAAGGVQHRRQHAGPDGRSSARGRAATSRATPTAATSST